jgi:sugar lactone lactonase YvrE
MSLDISYSGGVFSAPQAKSVGTVTAGTGTYNLAAASYDSVSFSFATQDTFVHDIAFKDDGTKMYITGGGNDSVFQYSLSTAGDLSTASYDSVSLSVKREEGVPTSLFFKPDGSKFYIAGSGQDTVFQYSMSTSWDISTASYESKSFSVATQETNPRDVSFKSDGTKMYVTGVDSDRIDEYSLSTAWDVSTASHTTNFSVASQDGNPQSLFFNPDGSKVWIVGSANNTVYQYSLSTAWDISTSSYDSVSFSVSSQMTGASGIEFKSDGTKMYVCDIVNDAVYQYSTGTATTLDLSTGNYFSHTPSVNTAFAFSNPPASGTAAGFALALTGANVAEAYDIANASYDSVSFSVLSQEGNPEALFFKPDGLKLYITGTTGDDVNEYDLSTAWDISTASYLQNFSVSAQDATPTGLFFKPDGTKMYISGSTGDDINEYDLSTAWDVSTASYSQNFSVATEDTIPTDLFFKPDGTKMYMLGTIGDDVNEYDLSTAWDISTASYSQNFSFSTQDGGVEGLFFSTNGTKMFMVGRVGDNVYEYDLSTAWDFSTGSYVRSFSVSGQDTNPRGLSFKSDGSKMYIIGLNTDTIYQYTTGSTATATFTYPSSVKFPSGTAPAGPAIDETDVLVFYTDDGGTTYQGFKAGGAMQ